MHELMRLAQRVSTYAPTHSNRVVLYNDQARSLATMSEMIDSAQSHVHLEYYIFKPDKTGETIRDALIAAARRGVQCRVLMDYIGSWSTRPSFTRAMVDAGVEVDYFLPVVPWQGPWRINFRNHRKILIVDGNRAFTGSHNIGNEYRGRHPTLGSWKDTNLSLEGPAVQQLQEVFVEDWFYTTQKELISDEYFPRPRRGGEHVVQVVPSGPDTDMNAIQDVIFAAICSAQQSVDIVTPYFVPDVATLQALQSAAYRGLKVQLVIPSRSDASLPLWAGRSFYEELYRAGVHIFEYDHGMLHNKIIVIDGCWSLVGSANIDHRSFRLNFELSVVLYDVELATELLLDIERFRSKSRRIAPRGKQFWSFGESIAVGAARLISPLL
jgi:cardiolipin synthase